GGIALIPDADPFDGSLDVLVLSADSITGWLDTLRTMVWDNGVKRVLTPRRHQGDDGTEGAVAERSDHVNYDRVTKLRVVLSEPRLVEIDGDELAEATQLEVEVHPSAVPVRGASRAG